MWKYIAVGILVLPVSLLSQDKKPWVVKGQWQASLFGYSSDGIGHRREPLRYQLNFNPRLSKGNWDIPLELSLYNVGFDSDYQFARFGIHPTWKWGKIHAGHTNLKVSSFSLNGRTLLGTGLELTPGVLRFTVLWGQTATAANSPLTNRVQPNAFATEMLTVKLGVGNRNHFLDLIYLKGEDQAGTIDSSRLYLDQYPAENLVLAARTEHYFFKRKWFVGGEFAGSAYNWNQNSLALAEVTDDLPSIPNWLLDPTVATQLSTAMEAFVGFRNRKFNTKIQYQKIGAGFRSMGSYFFQDDLEKIDLSLGFRMLKNKLRVKTSAGFRQNNLSDDKSLKTVRSQGLLNLYFRPNAKWNFNGTYSNYQTEQTVKTLGSRDSLRTALVSSNLNIGAQYNRIGSKKYNHQFSLRGGMQTAADRYKLEGGMGETQNYLTSLNYRMQTPKKKLELRGGLEYFGLNSDFQESARYGGSVAGLFNLKKNKLQLGIGSRQIISDNQKSADAISIMPYVTAGWRANTWKNFTLRLQYNHQEIKNNASPSFNEWQFTARYNHRFKGKSKKSLPK